MVRIIPWVCAILLGHIASANTCGYAHSYIVKTNDGWFCGCLAGYNAGVKPSFCDVVKCPLGSSGVDVGSGCTCNAGYSGSITAKEGTPWFTGACVKITGTVEDEHQPEEKQPEDQMMEKPEDDKPESYSYSSYASDNSSYASDNSSYSYYRRRYSSYSYYGYYSSYRRRYSYYYSYYRRRFSVATPRSIPAKWIQPDFKKLTKFTTGVNLSVTDWNIGGQEFSRVPPILRTIHTFGLSGNVKADIIGEKLTIDLSGHVAVQGKMQSMNFVLALADGAASLKLNSSVGFGGVTAGTNYCLRSTYPTGYLPAGAFLKDSLVVAKPAITLVLNEKFGHEDATYSGQSVARFSRDSYQADGGSDYVNVSLDLLYDATPVHASLKYNMTTGSSTANLNFNDWEEASSVSTEHCSGTWLDLHESPEAMAPLLAYDEVMKHLQHAGLSDLVRAFPAQALPLFAPRVADALAQMSEPESDNRWTVMYVVCALGSVSFGVMLVLFRRRTPSQYEPLL